jgi:hypothetical protein
MTDRKSLLEQALDVCLYAPVGLAISVTEELPQLIDKGRTRVTSQLAMAKMVGTFAVAQGQREAERVVRQATGRVSEAGPFGTGPFGTPPAREAGPTTPPAREAGPTTPPAREAGPTTPPAREADPPTPPTTGEPGGVDAARWTTPASGPEPTDGDGAGVSSPADGSARSDGVAAAAPPTGSAAGEDTSAPLPAPETPPGDPSALAIPGYDALSASHVVQRLAGLASDELEAVRTYEAATRGRRTILNRIAQLQAPGRS